MDTFYIKVLEGKEPFKRKEIFQIVIQSHSIINVNYASQDVFNTHRTGITYRNKKLLSFVTYYITYIPTDGVSTLSWWWGLSAHETLRAMLAVE
jgi:hypothetical protein